MNGSESECSQNVLDLFKATKMKAQYVIANKIHTTCFFLIEIQKTHLLCALIAPLLLFFVLYFMIIAVFSETFLTAVYHQIFPCLHAKCLSNLLDCVTNVSQRPLVFFFCSHWVRTVFGFLQMSNSQLRGLHWLPKGVWLSRKWPYNWRITSVNTFVKNLWLLSLRSRLLEQDLDLI